MLKLILFILIIAIAILIFWQLFWQIRGQIKTLIGGVEPTVITELVREYLAWTVTEQRKQILIKGRDRKEIYEATNILERWLISCAQVKDTIDLSKHPATEKMKQEMIEKNLTKSLSDADEIVEKLLSAGPKPPPNNSRPRIIGNKLVFANYERELSPERIEILRRFASDEQIIMTSLRYSSIISGSQQWNIPSEVYNCMIKNHGVTVEGFASPFNSQIIRFSTKDLPMQFCSLFPDVDAIFGSIGSFFDNEFAGMKVTINPPFILDIMNRMVDKCIQDLGVAQEQNLPTRFFITVPDWLDAEYYLKLEQCEYLEKKYNHTKGEYYYEDSNNKDIKIPARFNTTLFILSTQCAEENYDDINNAFRLQ